MAGLILHLVRHPAPDIAPGICYGQRDIAARDIAATASTLRATLPTGLPMWSSPLRRCRALAEALHPAPVIDARLAEMHFGAWEGQPWDDIPRAEIDAWAADIAGYAPPGGESPAQMQARALDFVSALRVPEAVLITHAGIIRTLVAHARALPPAEWPALSFAYGSHTVLAFPG